MRDQQNERCSCAPFNIEKGFLKRGYSKQLFHRKQCQAINLFVLSLAPESIVWCSSSLDGFEIDRRTQASLSPDLSQDKGFLKHEEKKSKKKGSISVSGQLPTYPSPNLLLS